jgi:thiol:disulfide interchange protein
VALPKGKAHHDDNFGDVEGLRRRAKVPFSRASPDALDVVVTGGFKAADSICYLPGEQNHAARAAGDRRLPRARRQLAQRRSRVGAG